MLSPHPADPTLTTDNLMEVVKGVEYHWGGLGLGLDVPQSKKRKIRLWNHKQTEGRKPLSILRS